MFLLKLTELGLNLFRLLNTDIKGSESILEQLNK